MSMGSVMEAAKKSLRSVERRDIFFLLVRISKRADDLRLPGSWVAITGTRNSDACCGKNFASDILVDEAHQKKIDNRIFREGLRRSLGDFEA
jgi:hypothetical protein